MSNKTFKELRNESSVPANVAGSGKFAGLPPDDPVVRLKKKKKKKKEDSVDEGPKYNPKDPMLPIEKEAISDFYKEIHGFRPRGSSFWKNIKTRGDASDMMNDLELAWKSRQKRGR